MKQIYVVIVALLAGFVGGFIGSRLALTRERPRVEQLLRSRAFELTDETGKTLAYWGVDKGGNAVLAFGSNLPSSNSGNPVSGLDDPQNQRASLGVTDDSPFLSFRALDGKKRLNLALSEAKPILWMADQKEKRLSLGFQLGDTPDPTNDNWALAFLPNRARVGMFSVEEGGRRYLRGLFSVSKDAIEYPDLRAR
jgi:hypothetical protein